MSGILQMMFISNAGGGTVVSDGTFSGAPLSDISFGG